MVCSVSAPKSVWAEADLALLAGSQGDGLFDSTSGLPGLLMVARSTPRTRSVGEVAQVRCGWSGARCRCWAAAVRCSPRSRRSPPRRTCVRYTGFQIPALRSATKELPLTGFLFGPLVAEVVPVDPVEPAVGEFDAVDVLQGPLRGDLDGERVGTSRLDPPGDVEVVVDVHAHDLIGVGHQVTVQPDLGAVVDAGEVQLVGAVARLARRTWCGTTSPARRGPAEPRSSRFLP